MGKSKIRLHHNTCVLDSIGLKSMHWAQVFLKSLASWSPKPQPWLGQCYSVLAIKCWVPIVIKVKNSTNKNNKHLSGTLKSLSHTGWPWLSCVCSVVCWQIASKVLCRLSLSDASVCKGVEERFLIKGGEITCLGAPCFIVTSTAPIISDPQKKAQLKILLS